MQKLMVRFVAACAAVMIATSAFATAYTWNSAKTSGNWDDHENWLVNNAATDSYPSTANDTAAFSADTTASISFTSAKTISQLDLSASNINITFTQDGAGTNETKLTANSINYNGANGAIVLDGVAILDANATTSMSVDTTTMGAGRTVTLKNGANFCVSMQYFNWWSGGKLTLQGGSFFYAKDFWCGPDVEIDDSTFSSAGHVFQNQHTWRFAGKHPRYISRYGLFAAEWGCSADITFEFSVPCGGYDEPPISTVSSPAWAMGTYYDKSTKLTMNVTADSPAKQAGESLTTTLIDWPSKGIRTDKVFAGTLPQSTDSFTWGALADSNPVSLSVTLSGSYIAVAEKITEGNKWQGLELSLPSAAEADCEIFAAWGPTNGGTTLDAWANHDSAAVATIATGATTASYTFPSDGSWGTDTFKFIRFYYVKDGTTYWSPVQAWRNLDTPQFGTWTADGTGGDAIRLVGAMKSFPGSSCTLTAYVGTTKEEVTEKWANLDGAVLSSDDKSFSLTLCRKEGESAPAFTPGATYYVAIEATANGETTRTETREVTLSAGTAVWASASQTSVSRRTATVTGKFSDPGVNGAVVTVWYGTTADRTTFVQLEGFSKTVTDTDAFTLEIPLPGYGQTFYYELRATNTSVGGTMSATTVYGNGSAIFTASTKDETTYTWTGKGADSKWSTKENWDDGCGGDSLGYPGTADATAAFAAGTTNVVTFDAVRTIKKLDLSAADVCVTFEQGGAGTNETKLTANCIDYSGANGAIVLDGVAILDANATTSTSGATMTMGAGRTVTLKNGANFCVSMQYFNWWNGGKLTLQGGSFFYTKYFWCGPDVEIDDSTFYTAGLVFNKQRTWRFAGKRPRYINCSSIFSAEYGCSADIAFEFVIPRGGYDEAPITLTAGSLTMGSYANRPTVLTMNVAADSPAKFEGEELETTLINWSAGINKDYVFAGTVPQTSDAFVWGDGTTPTTLGVKFSGSYIQVEEVIEDGAWKALNLAMDPASGNRDLYVAWGPTDGEETLANWAHVDTIANAIPDMATTCTYTLPSSWGTDANKVVRFYLLKDGEIVWSPTTTWRELTGPSFESGLTLDGTGGDTLKVSAALKSFTGGGTCALKVLVGTTEDNLDRTFDAGTMTQGGAFEVTVGVADATSADYLKPGETYYACVEATIGNESARTTVGKVTMAGAATWAATPTATVSHNKATISGQFLSVGMGGTAKVTLWYRESSASEFEKATDIELTVTDPETFTFTYDFPECEKTYVWQLRAENTSAGGQTTLTTLAASVSSATKDEAVYTWVGRGQTGVWADKDNWQDDKGGICLGYPQSASSTAKFTAENPATIVLDAAWTIKCLDFSAAGASATFVTNGVAARDTVRLTVTALDAGGENGSLVLDGTALTVSGVTKNSDGETVSVEIGKGFLFSLKNAADLYVSNGTDGYRFNNRKGGTLSLAGGSTLSTHNYRTGPVEGGYSTIIDDSTMTVRWFAVQDDGAKYLIKGAAPSLYWGPYTSGGTASSVSDVDFLVPRDGYENPPVTGGGQQL